MKLSFKYRLYPNKQQVTIIQQNLNFCCFLYNSALEERKSYYKKYGKSRSYNEQAAMLPEIKREFAERTQSIYAQSLQQVLKRLDQSYKDFFRRVKQKADRVGFPRFKSSDRFRSIVFPQTDLTGKGGIKLLENGKLRIFGLPGEVRVKLHRPWKGRCKQASIKKEGDKFYLVLSCDAVPLEPLPKTNKTIGIDLGLNSFITADDGTSFHHPKPYKTAKEKLAYLNRKLERKQRGSNNRLRVKKELARTYAKVSNIRNDFLHKTALRLVKENDIVIVEDLNVKGMLEKEKPQPKTDANGKRIFQVVVKKDNIQDASWDRFSALISYKAERAGKIKLEVNPRNTSKMCSGCGNVKQDLTLADRTYHCEACGFEMERDKNAAINIKRLGMSLATVQTVSEVSA